MIIYYFVFSVFIYKFAPHIVCRGPIWVSGRERWQSITLPRHNGKRLLDALSWHYEIWKISKLESRMRQQ